MESDRQSFSSPFVRPPEESMEVSPGGFQLAVLAAFLVVTASLVAIFVLVARQAKHNVEFEQVTSAGYRLRRYWLGFLALLLTSGVVLALFFLPDAARR